MSWNAVEWLHRFRAACFAIVDDHNAWREHNPEGNMIPFQRELNGLKIRA